MCQGELNPPKLLMSFSELFSMLKKIALYHSFLWLIFHCMHNISVFIHAPIYGHLWLFPCLCYCTLCYYKHCCAYHFSDGSFHLTGYMTSSFIVGSYSNCIFRVLETAAKSLQLCPILCDLTEWEPTRLPHPWDSPDKNTRVGYHFFLQCMKVKSEKEVTQSCLTLQPHRHQPTRFLCPWDFPGKSIGHYRMLLIFLQYMVDLHGCCVCLFVCLFFPQIYFSSFLLFFF